MTRICKNCQELVFGPLCPFCERQASKLSDDDYSLDSEIEVDRRLDTQHVRANVLDDPGLWHAVRVSVAASP